jgi:hypothetical protein
MKKFPAACSVAMTFVFLSGLCGAAEPIDLTGKYNVTISNLVSTGFPGWKTMPAGHQVFRNVPFDIGGELHLWGLGRATNGFSPYPEIISGIAVNRKFETLYIYHCAHFKTPAGTPVCKVVLHYENGAAATNALCYGEDMIDWLVGGNEQPMKAPRAGRSKIAFVGGQFSDTEKNRVRFCLTAVPNPHPDWNVTTVDAVSCKTRVAPILMAMTTGPAGLMASSADNK